MVRAVEPQTRHELRWMRCMAGFYMENEAAHRGSASAIFTRTAETIIQKSEREITASGSLVNDTRHVHEANTHP